MCTTTTSIDACRSCKRVDQTDRDGQCMACAYQGEPECALTCDGCLESIDAGSTYRSVSPADGDERETDFDYCHDCAERFWEKGWGKHLSAWKTHACGCAPCASRRLVAQLQASLRSA